MADKNQDNQKDQEEDITSEEKTEINMEAIQSTFSSVTSFFSVIYGIILILSISYNVGFFKYINPQIVDFMTVGDYINDTIHNIGLFLVAGFLFFISSLAFARKRLEGKFGRLVLFGLFTLIICGGSFFKEMRSSKFWPAVTHLWKEYSSVMLLAVSILAMMIFLIAFLVYRLTFKVVKDDVPMYSISFIPLVITFLLVLTPYFGGMVQGYMENNFYTPDDYKSQSVNVKTLVKGDDLTDLYIIKQIDKGVIFRHYKNNGDPTENTVFFMNYGDIQRIFYKKPI